MAEEAAPTVGGTGTAAAAANITRLTAPLVAFDIETVRLFKEAEIAGSEPMGLRVVAVCKWQRTQQLAPASASCAPQHHEQFTERVWHAKAPTAEDDKAGGGAQHLCLGSHCVEDVVDYLWQEFQDGAQLMTWNGTLSDWVLLAMASGTHCAFHRCKVMAAGSVDLPFGLLCMRGYMVGLSTVSQAASLPDSKPIASVLSADAWTRDSYRAVVALCISDALNTVHIALLAMQHGVLRWYNRMSRLVRWFPPRQRLGTLSTVDEIWRELLSGRMRFTSARWSKTITPALCCLWMAAPTREAVPAVLAHRQQQLQAGRLVDPFLHLPCFDVRGSRRGVVLPPPFAAPNAGERASQRSLLAATHTVKQEAVPSAGSAQPAAPALVPAPPLGGRPLGPEPSATASPPPPLAYRLPRDAGSVPPAPTGGH